MLQISCASCGAKVLRYQKDGPGILKRLYFDRIDGAVKQTAPLSCPKCKTMLGVPYVYHKEKREAFRLFVGAVSKKIIKAQ